MSKEISIRLCHSCLVGVGLLTDTETQEESDSFSLSLANELSRQNPSVKWTVQLTGCLDVCPDSQVGLAVQPLHENSESLKSNTQDPTLRGIVSECLKKASELK